MKIPFQLTVGLGILLLGGGVLAGEYFLVKWLPRYRELRAERILELLPYRNDALGVEMQVAAGLYDKVENFAGGVRISRPKMWRLSPSLTITSQPNPDGTSEFSPFLAAKWQTQGVYEELPRYHYERTRINGRDAVLIWQYKNRAMLLTARVLSPERLIEVYCTPGQEDEDLYMKACDASVRTIKIAGPEPPPPVQPVLELSPPGRKTGPRR
jgi:hypothetical protein